MAVAPIRPLAWELSYAEGAAQEMAKRQEKKKKKKQVPDICCRQETLTYKDSLEIKWWEKDISCKQQAHESWYSYISI